MAVKINAKRLDYLTRERSDSDSRGRFTRGRALKGVKWKPAKLFAMKYREAEEE